MTTNEIIETLILEFPGMVDFDLFVEMDKSDLISLHNTLGLYIRNRFKLWKTEWKPELLGGVDYSDAHPDAISMFIVTEVWKHFQDA